MSILWRRSELACVATAALAVACAPPKTVPDPDQTKPAVTSADLRANEPIEVTLQRKAPGVMVTRVGNEIALQIRGASSYNGSSSPPLYILNGLKISTGPGGLLSGVNPLDIDTIKVLRGADAGLYGIEGANGVILITTKRGGRP